MKEKNYRNQGYNDYKTGRYNPGPPGSDRSNEYHNGRHEAWKDEVCLKKGKCHGE